MNKIYQLHKWSVVSSYDPYKAPEAKRIQLTGFRDNETSSVITSDIVDIDGKSIKTLSGSIYILDDIDPEYLSWLEANEIDYDPDNPIK
jgi:hypothetical protein